MNYFYTLIFTFSYFYYITILYLLLGQQRINRVLFIIDKNIVIILSLFYLRTYFLLGFKVFLILSIFLFMIIIFRLFYKLHCLIYLFLQISIVISDVKIGFNIIIHLLVKFLESIKIHILSKLCSIALKTYEIPIFLT